MNYQTIRFVPPKKHEEMPIKNGETGMNSGIGKLPHIRGF
jgi:hypothetical protein